MSAHNKNIANIPFNDLEENKHREKQFIQNIEYMKNSFLKYDKKTI